MQLSRAYKPEKRRTPGPGTQARASLSSPSMSTPGGHGIPTTPSSGMAAVGSFGATPIQSPTMLTMDPLQSKFIAFAVFGKGPAAADQAMAKPKSVVMDSKGFAKLCKESKIMSGRLDLTRVDLCFTKCSDKVCSNCDAVWPERHFTVYISVCIHACRQIASTFNFGCFVM
jgi:hypothetical protein